MDVFLQLGQVLINFATAHPVALLVAVCVEQILAQIPWINGNSTFQVIARLIVGLKNAIIVPPTKVASPEK